jgi:excinuclease UvrABC helicase subunit UvrB
MEDFMKFGLMITLLLVSQLSFGQTLNAKKVKNQMLERVDTLSSKITETTDALKTEDVGIACQKLNEIFNILPSHLNDIATKMNLFDGKVVRMVQETQMHLQYIEQQKEICKVGETGEFLELKELTKKLNSIKKALASQKKKIQKLDTNYSNIYHYNSPGEYKYHGEWSYSYEWSY